jgi:hypothetical protein
MRGVSATSRLDDTLSTYVCPSVPDCDTEMWLRRLSPRSFSDGQRAARVVAVASELPMIAIVIEMVIASAISMAVWNSGHPVWAVVAWFGVMSFSNVAQRTK